MSYKIISNYQIKSRDVPSVVHPFLTNMYLRKFHIKRMLEADKVLVVEHIPKSDSVLDHFGKVRNDVPFSLRCHLRNVIGESGLRFGSLGGSRNRVVESDAQAIVSEFAKIPPLSASVVEYEKKYSASKNMTQVKSPAIEEMLENPELDSVSSVNLDPASMLVDDVDSFIKEGSDFVENPSFGGAAMMAAIAIPGKLMDDSVGKFIGKYKGKDIELDNISINTINYKKRDRDEYTQLRKEFDNSIRKNYLKDLSKNIEVVHQLKSHGVKDSEIAKLADGKVPRGYQVHHKIPLDDGGTNNYDNFVLIRNSPEHSVFTTYQKQQTSNLSVGSDVSVQWPSPNGSVYPKK